MMIRRHPIALATVLAGASAYLAAATADTFSPLAKPSAPDDPPAAALTTTASSTSGEWHTRIDTVTGDVRLISFGGGIEPPGFYRST